MTNEINTSKKDLEKIDVLKHFITEAIEDEKSGYVEFIKSLIGSTLSVINGKKEITAISDKQFFYVEFFLNFKKFFKKFDEVELTYEVIRPELPELLNIANQWKAPSQIIDDLKDNYTRLYADFENYKKRVVKEKEELSANLRVKMSSDIISIMDDLSIAKMNLAEEAKGGVDIIFKKFENYLNTQNIVKIDINKGDMFNADLAECIATLPSADFKDGQIIDILKNAWSLNGKIAKFAQVVVCKN